MALSVFGPISTVTTSDSSFGSQGARLTGGMRIETLTRDNGSALAFRFRSDGGEILSPLMDGIRETEIEALVGHDVFNVGGVVTALIGGGFALTVGVDNDVFTKTFNANGVATSALVKVNTDSTGDQFIIGANSVTATPDGGYVVVWTDNSHGSDVVGYPGPFTANEKRVDDTMGQSFTATGVANGQNFLAQSASPQSELAQNQQRGAAAALANGSIAYVYYDFSPIYNQSQTAVGAPNKISLLLNGTEIAVNDDYFDFNNGRVTSSSAPQIARLSDGNLAVAWLEFFNAGSTNTQEYHGRVYAPDGTALTADTVLASAPNSGVTLPAGGFFSLEAMDGGQFAILYSIRDKAGDGSADTRLSTFNANATLRDTITIGSGALNQYQDDLSYVGDGALLVTYVDQASGFAHKSQFVISPMDGQTVFNGDGTDQSVVGGALGDWIDGGGGTDTLSGAGGNDHLFGGAGSDAIYAGDGNDVLTDGGQDSLAVRDFLYGGVGNDTYEVWDTLASAQDIVYEGPAVGGAQGGPSDVDTIISTGEFFRDFYSTGEVLRLAEGANTSFATTYLVGGADSNAQIFGNSGSNIISTYGGSKTVDAGGGTDAISFSLYDLDANFEGVNTLVSRAGTGIDYLYDFQSGIDKVDLRAFNFGITGQQVLDQGINVFGSDPNSSADEYVYFYLTNAGGVDNYVAFVGLTTAQLHAADFITA